VNDVSAKHRNRSPSSIIGATAVLLGAAVILALLLEGSSEDAVRSVVRSSAKLAVVLFAAAFSASSLQSLHPSAFSGWMLRNRRYLGLSFALSHTVHLAGLIALALAFPAPFVEEVDALTLVGGGVAYAFVFAMAITSTDAAVARLGRKRWRLLHTVGGYYIWTLFLQSYVPRAIQDPAYIPWALVVMAPIMLRGLRWLRMRRERAEV
jgi:sulfoxide reductase heme-binding subunit YedZ